MEKTSGSWEDVYRNARKSEKQKADAYERDEGELERTGQPLCIYEIYTGQGAWSFLHHGSIYRGITLVCLRFLLFTLFSFIFILLHALLFLTS